MKRMYTYMTLALVVTGMFACVPARKLQETENKLTACQNDLTSAKTRADEAEKNQKDLEKELADLRKQSTSLQKDTAVLGTSLRIMRSQYDKINELNKDIQRQLEMLRKGAEDDSRKLTGELDITRRDLIAKEEALKVLEKELGERKAALEDREQRIKELEALIARKDQAVKDLQSKVAEALLSFKDKGLTVVQKNGKVYVSMEAKLLFASLSYNVDKEGKEALVKLARVLESQKDLEVLVEGHTDTDPIRSNTVPVDNWELSVLRATSVVKLMLKESKMDPKLITAAGRSEFVPVDPADKSKNRRIEVILIPNLDELYKLLEKK